MKKTIELLAPGGDVDSIKAAIAAGADAIYCGLSRFNARNRATNITFDDLNGILRLAHKNNCQIFLTLNIIIVESEIPALFGLLNKLINTSIDGIIIQDLGLFYIIQKFFNSLKIHASTQLTTHNEGQIKFLAKLSASRINLSRELNIGEIKALTQVAHNHHILTEVFVHGSYCISMSGLCYMSSVHGGNSGNRGRCSQPCRDQYTTTPAGKNFPLNLKDNAAFTNIKELYQAGVDSMKIEGRIKKFHYVYTIVNAYKSQLKCLYKTNQISNDNSVLYKVFNRDFSNSYLKGTIHKNMFIDNPRDNSAIQLAKSIGNLSPESLEKAKSDVYNERTKIIDNVKNIINQINIAKAPLTLTFSGKASTPLKVTVKTPDTEFILKSESLICKKGSEALGKSMLLKRFKAINETEYFIDEIYFENNENDVFIPFKDITALRKRILLELTCLKESIKPSYVPKLKYHNNQIITPGLSVLINSINDLIYCNNTKTNIYYQLPNHLSNKFHELINLFKSNKITPWFPSILIDNDFSIALKFLKQLQPRKIVTNNTGIAYEAYKLGIPWIAGPYLNIVNSFSLFGLKESFNCAGAFISNELSKQQIQSIKKPSDFELYYSIYHPIDLMTSRQCLFHMVSGCNKNKMDDSCIKDCEKQTSITNMKNASFTIVKTKGSLNHIYNNVNFLNADIVKDFPHKFTGFFIDLINIKNKTKIQVDKTNIIDLFERHISTESDLSEELKQNICPTTYQQYSTGI